MGHLGDGTLLGSWETTRNMLGAGGFRTSGNQANDGFRIGYSDTAGPEYIRPGETAWTKFFRVGDNYTTSLDNLVGFEGDVSGATRVADTNSDVIGSLINGNLLRTTDGAVTIQKTNLPKLTYDGHESWSFGRGTHFRIDPHNENVWWFGDPVGGLAISNDMFDTYSFVDNTHLPLPSAGVGAFSTYAICFDQFSLSGGKSQRAVISVPGAGIYLTTNAGAGVGATWALIADSPTLYCHMDWGSDGKLHVVEYDGTGVYHRWDASGGWLATTYLEGVAGPIDGSVRPVVDPNTAGKILLFRDSSGVRISLDNGVHFDGPDGSIDRYLLRRARNIPWHGWTNELSMSHGDAYFSKIVPGRLHLEEGIGHWFTDSIPDIQSNATPITFYEDSVGIENMTNNVLMISPLGAWGVTCWDRTQLAQPYVDIGKFPRTNGPNADDPLAVPGQVGHGNMDWAFDDPTYLVGTAFCVGAEQGGYSTNEGRNWNAFPGSYYTDSGGQNGAGNIAALSKQVHIWHGYGGNQEIMYTVDGGASWLPMNSFFGPNFITGNTYSANTGLHKKILVKDEYHQWVAYYYDIGTNSSVAEASPPPGGETSGEQAARLQRIAEDLASRGVWKIVYNPGGSPLWTCTRQRTSLLDLWGVDYYSGKLIQYGDGHWLWAPGQGGRGLYETFDNWVTDSLVTGIDDINPGSPRNFRSPYAVAIGRGALPGDPRTVTVIGHRPPDSSVAETSHAYYGEWHCRNFTAADASRQWVRITQFPGNETGGFWGEIADAVACPINYGRFYVAGGRSGVWQHRHVDRRVAAAA